MVVATGLAFVFPIQSTAAQKASRGSQVQDGYSLAFVEADVRRVADAILGSMLGANYEVDPAVQGNITLRTANSVPRDQLIPLFETSLQAVDAIILVQGGTYRVVARKRSGSATPIASAGRPVAGYATEAIPVRRGSPKEIGKLVEQLLGKEAVAGIDTVQSQILVTGTTEERQAARALVQRLDVDMFANMNFELYKLENADANVLVGELGKIFAPPFDVIGSRVRVVPLPRLRSLLVIGSEKGDFARLEQWIRRLDAGSSGARKLYSYAVQNGRARDLAVSLQLVLGEPIGQAAVGTSGMTQSASGIASEPQSDSEAARQSIVPTAQPLAQPASGIRIVPNEVNNSLLVYADGAEYEFIREALEKLDQPVAQVLIEATLAEVTLTDELRYGVDWAIAGGRTTFNLSNSANAVPTRVVPGFSFGYVGPDVTSVLNALQSKTNVRVLSSPKLLVLNNQTASLQVGDQVPIVTQQSQSVAAPGAPIVNTIELRDTGVILKVTPRVNDSGTIILDISQEVSDVARTTTSGINSPTIQQRKLASTVATRSGQMIALGGLIRERATSGRSGIPLLSQIPVIGGVFGQQTKEGSRTELIILLTPTVIKSPEESRAAVDTLINALDDVRPIIGRALEKQVGGRTPQQ
jgi:general secretion pathway protein D